VIAADQTATVSDSTAAVTATTASTHHAQPAHLATAGEMLPEPGTAQTSVAPGESAAVPAPVEEATTLRRRQDVGDLVVRAGTAFEEYRQGVPGAIDTLVRLVSPLLWHTARQCGLTAAESEDVVQQTFLSLVRSKDSVSDPLAVVRWLTVSLRRLAWRERANSAKRSNEEPSDDDLPRAPSAEHTAVLTDQQRRLWEKVGELSERCRRLLAVIAFAPRPDYATIAVDLGIPVGSIGPTRGRCLAKLRTRLDGGDWT
jgi:RNA polymerase sigma factor (sigma-70 family)